MEDFSDAESSTHKSNRREGKSSRNLQLKKFRASLNASNSAGVNVSFMKNGIIDDTDSSDGTNSDSSSHSEAKNNLTLKMQSEDEKGSSKCDNGVDMGLCKPCSVILERFSEEQVRLLVSRDNSPIKNRRNSIFKWQKSASKKENLRLRSRGGKFVANPLSRTVGKKRLKDLLNKQQHCEGESTDSPESNSESRASDSRKNIDKSEPVLNEEKLGRSNNLAENKDFRMETSRIGDLSECEASGISREVLESKVALPKRFDLSLRKKAANKQDDETPTQDPSSEILQTVNLEIGSEQGIGSENPRSKLSLSNRTRLKIKKKMAIPEEAETCKRDLCNETTQVEDLNTSQNSELTSEISKSVVKPRKHFNLSVTKKKADREEDSVCKQNSGSNGPQNSKEVSRNITPRSDKPRSSLKRRLVNGLDDEACVPKLKKSEDEEDATSHDDEGVNQVRLRSRQSGVPRHTGQKDTLDRPKLRSNVRCKQKVSCEDKQKVSCEDKHKAPIKKDVKVSLMKLEYMANPSTSKQVDNVKPSGCSKILETKQTELGEDCFQKSRNRKITDYFSRIDKSSFILQNSSKNLRQGEQNLMLKKKYGICKDATVSLIDLKLFKIAASKYSASEIEKLSQEYHKSSVNSLFTSTTDTAPHSSSVPSSSNLPHNFNTFFTNDPHSHTDVTNLSSVHDHLDELSPDSSHTSTIPMTQNLSPIIRKSLCGRRHSPVKRTENSLNNISSSRISTLRSGKQIQLANSTNHVDYHFVHEDSSVEHNVLEKNLPSQNSSELETKSPSSSANDEELRNHSVDSRIINATPKSQKTSNSGVRNSPLTPGKRNVLINDEIESNESQASGIDVTSESPQSDVPQENSSAVSLADVSKVSHGSNKPREEMNDTSATEKDSNVVIDEPNPHVTIIKSPMKVVISKPQVKHEATRCLPLNSMTILSREMLDENYSWIGFDDGIDKVTETSATTEKNHTIQGNDSSDTLAESNSPKDKTRISSDRAKSVDNNPLSNSDIDDTIENAEPANVSGDARRSTEFRDKHLGLTELLNSKSTENLSPERPACTNVKTGSSEMKTSTQTVTVEKNVDDLQRSNLPSEIETSELNIPISEVISPVENSIDRSSVMSEDRDCENSNSQHEIRTESQQEGELVIDEDGSDSDPQSVAGILPGTSSSSCSKSSVTLQDEETGKTTEESPMKECVICNQIFAHVVGLRKHLKVHINCTQDSCLICDKPLTKKNAIEHYLEHCGCAKNGGTRFCSICKIQFMTRSAFTNHSKAKHNVGRNKRKQKQKKKILPQTVRHNECSICLLSCNSEIELFEHVYTHTQKELQDAFENAKAKQLERLSSTPSTPTVSENQGSETSGENATQDKEKVTSESAKAKDTLPTLPPAIPDCEISICMCHKDERLEISGGVIIEVALACVQCKTFFKSRKCFEDHYNATACERTDETVATAKMFCNRCSVIINTLPELQTHLIKHREVDAHMKTSFLCKQCNIFFFGIGSLFYDHWFCHSKNSLFVADHCSFPKNTTVKIVEPGALEPVEKDEPTESLFIPEHQCRSCQKPFQTEGDLKKHLGSSDSCSEKVQSTPQVIQDSTALFKLICSICNNEFGDKSSFDAHIKAHDTIKEFLPGPTYSNEVLENDRLVCSICKSEHNTITNYKKHLSTHEVIQEKFVCNYCTLMMDSVEDFERHSAEHKGTLEKPVACKVVFATTKFHCKPCKIRFDNQSRLDEHLATHNKPATSTSKSGNNTTPEVALAAEKKSLGGTTHRQEFDDQVTLKAHATTHHENIPDQATVNPTVVHLSDDSNSTDIEIIATEKNYESDEPLLENHEQQEQTNTQESKKPTFLRVKNLKELLPYACAKCKAEFDTQINLSKHVCNQNVKPAQDKNFSYVCTLCKDFQCNNEAAWNLHKLSHSALRSSPRFSESWFHLLRTPSGQHVFKCNICSKYESLTSHTMRHHFIIVHPDIYRPVFECRVCNTFKTETEEEIRRHEAAHFPISPLPALTGSSSYSASVQPVENSNKTQQRVSIPPATRSSNDTPSLQSEKDLNNSWQRDSIPSLINLSDNLPPVQPIDNSNNFRQKFIPNQLLTRSGNNISWLQLLQNFNNSREMGSTCQPHNNSTNLQQSFSSLPVTSSGGDLSVFQPLPSFNNSQQLSATLQPDNNANNFQRSIQIPLATSLASNLPALIKSTTGSDNNSSASSPLQNFNHSQQLDSRLQRDNNSNNFQPSISLPPVTSSGSNLPSVQPMENSQWLTTTGQTFQIQINSGLPFNNMTNVVQTLPMYVTNVLYSCSICKNYKCSSQQKLKEHEALHKVIQSEETAKRLYSCRVCPNIFCPTEDHFRAHMESHHNAEKSKSQDQTQTNSADTNAQIKCKYCIQSFASSAQLTQHIYTCHTYVNQQQSNTQYQNVYPYSCNLCSIGFLNESFLHAHIKQDHPGIKLPHQQKLSEPKTLYQCQTCGLLLISEETLNYHMKSHNVGFH